MSLGLVIIMAKNKNEENIPKEVEATDVDKLLEEFTAKGMPEQTPKADEEKPSRKPIRAIKTINADGRLLAAYEALRKEGYKKSFDDFLVDASMFFAKGKYGLDFVIEKSLTPDNDEQYFKVRKKGDGDEEDEENGKKKQDSVDLAIKMLMGGGGGFSDDPRLQVLSTLLEQRRLELEEKRTKIEREKLENEKLRAEIENIKKSKTQEQTETKPNNNENVMEIIKFIVDQNQKFYESMADIYKATATNKGNPNETMELYKLLAQQQQQYYQTMTNFLTNSQMEKIKELESYVSAMNPGVWLTQKAEEFKALKEIFGGGGNKTPEEIEREYQLRLEELKLKHEAQKEERETQRAIELTNSIKEGLSAFTEQIGKPLGEALASQIKNMGNKSPEPSINPNAQNIPPENPVVTKKPFSVPLETENPETDSPPKNIQQPSEPNTTAQATQSNYNPLKLYMSEHGESTSNENTSSNNTEEYKDTGDDTGQS